MFNILSFEMRVLWPCKCVLKTRCVLDWMDLLPVYLVAWNDWNWIIDTSVSPWLRHEFISLGFAVRTRLVVNGAAASNAFGISIKIKVNRKRVVCMWLWLVWSGRAGPLCCTLSNTSLTATVCFEFRWQVAIHTHFIYHGILGRSRTILIQRWWAPIYGQKTRWKRRP